MPSAIGAAAAGPPTVKNQPPLLHQACCDALLAVVLFGSVARGTPHAHSDSDWLVVLRQRGAEPRLDHQGCQRARQVLAPQLAAQGSVRVPWGDGWYWRLTPEVRPAEEVWF